MLPIPDLLDCILTIKFTLNIFWQELCTGEQVMRVLTTPRQEAPCACFSHSQRLVLFNEWETLSHRKKKKTKATQHSLCWTFTSFLSTEKKLKRNYAKKKYQVFHYLLRVSNPPFFMEKTSICSSTHLYPCIYTSRMRVRHSILKVAVSAGVKEQGVCTTVYTSARPTLSCARIQLLFSLLIVVMIHF